MTSASADNDWQFFSGPSNAGKYTQHKSNNPVSVEAVITDQTGWETLRKRYTTQILIRNDGVVNHGYGIMFFRSDELYFNSSIMLVENNTIISTLKTPFEYGFVINTSFTIYPNGSVVGNVRSDSNIFDFSFDPREIKSTGDYVAYCYELSSPSSKTVLPQVGVVFPAPEPATPLLVLSLSFALLCHRRR
jgi:hypothetical protein